MSTTLLHVTGDECKEGQQASSATTELTTLTLEASAIRVT